uniref:alpha/beta hydrolase family protein n=1 Tax=Herbidospora sakaeratensis TaxID=564415 RepID=UPI000783B49F|nr:alpha/beta hydrolase [Herbidospora sakaeratensis]
MTAEEIVFDGLTGLIAWPETPGPHPGVVIVHGSGAVDRFGAEGTLRPIIGHFAAAGYAVLSSDKPGHWETQTFDDRAAETVAACRFLAAHPRVDARRVGLWGISQGGWIGPMAASAAPDEIAFAILVSASPITPYEQAAHQIGGELRAAGRTEDEVGAALGLLAERTALLADGVPGARILAGEPPELALLPWYPHVATTAEELDFIRPIWHFDVLPHLAALRCPLLAIWGALDPHMPAARCAAITAAALADGGGADFTLQVVPGAGHRLRDSRGDLAAGYLDGMTSWLGRVVHDPITIGAPS